MLRHLCRSITSQMCSCHPGIHTSAPPHRAHAPHPRPAAKVCTRSSLLSHYERSHPHLNFTLSTPQSRLMPTACAPSLSTSSHRRSGKTCRRTCQACRLGTPCSRCGAADHTPQLTPLSVHGTPGWQKVWRSSPYPPTDPPAQYIAPQGGKRRANELARRVAWGCRAHGVAQRFIPPNSPSLNSTPLSPPHSLSAT
eukprot:9280-Chlamydomonas_euryale.AAC.1